MALTLRAVCLIVSIVLFVIAGVGVGTGRFNILAIGLAFFATAFLVG